MRACYIAFILALFTVHCFAQKGDRSDYNLLWKISGKGLSNPSYLFGTMHLRDNRAFDFNDSVLTKVIQCEAFAMEIHPDSVTKLVVSMILEQVNNKGIESKMKGKDYQYYDSLMKKNTGLPLSKFKSARQANYFLEHSSVKDDKNTFLDGWLYNVAREHNKIMVGLEGIKAQLSVIESDSSDFIGLERSLKTDAGKVGDQLQELLELYYRGNIDDIYSFSASASSKAHLKTVIVDRNNVMIESIIGSIHHHSTFIAVGAAHLGGLPGIVNSLRQRGYTVTPVKAPFSHTAEKYKHVGNSTEKKWFLYTSTEGGYSLEMPQAPVPMKMDDTPFTFQTYVDIGSLTMLMATHLSGALFNTTPAKALDEMVDRMKKNYKINSAKKIMVDGYEARELDASKGTLVFRIRVVLRQSNIYLLLTGPTEAGVNSPDAQRFLSSLKTMEPAKVNAAKFVHNAGAFSIDMPGTITSKLAAPHDALSGKDLKVHIFYASDNQTGSTYLVRYHDLPAGYIIKNDSAYVRSSVNTLCNGMKGVDIRIDTLSLDGLSSSHFTFSVPSYQTKVEGIVTIRGERVYLIFATYQESIGNETILKYFKSFRFLPFDLPTIKNVSFPDGISLDVPITFETDSAILVKENSIKYAFSDPLSGTMGVVHKKLLSRYREETSIDSFFTEIKNTYHEKNWRLKKDSVQSGQLPAHDYYFETTLGNTSIRVRFVLVGNSLISLWTYYTPDAPELVDRFYKSFKIKAASDWSILSDKSDQLLHDLQASDSTTRRQAVQAVSKYRFKVKHLPKIYEVLKKQHQDDTAAWTGTRAELLNSLRKVHDDTTVPFIENLYPTLPDSSFLREVALYTLSSMKSVASLRRMAEYIEKDTSGYRFSSYNILYPLTDTLALLDDVGVSLLSSFSKFRSTSQLFNLIKMGIDSNAFSPGHKQEILSLINTIAGKIANSRLDPKSAGYYELQNQKYDIINLLLSVPLTTQLRDILTRLALENDDEIRFACLSVYLKNGDQVSKNEINRLAANSAIRLKLYEELSKYGKQNLLGKRYSAQRMLAQSEIEEYLFDEDGAPETIDFVAEKTVVIDGVKKRIFVFSYRWDDSDDAHIAVAGPYPIKSDLFERGAFTEALDQKYRGEKDLNTQLSEYLMRRKMSMKD